MSDRLTKYQDVRGDWQIKADFDAIRKAVVLSQEYHRPAFVIGDDVHEEYVAYVSAQGRYIEYAGVVIDSKGRHPFDALRSVYWGQTATLRKIMGFLNYNAPSIELEVNGDTIKQVSLDYFESITEQLKNDYISSRKISEGALNEIELFLDRVSSVKVSGPVVVNVNNASVNYMQWIVINKWAKLDHFVPFVALSYPKNKHIINSDLFIERSPISVRELVDFLSEEQADKVKDIERYFDIWQASRAYASQRNHKSPISLYESGAFTSFWMKVDVSDSPIEAVSKAIPTKIIAPIMFAPADDLIGVDVRPPQGLSKNATKGAAKALKNQAQDIIYSGSIQNAAPGLVNVLSRIAAIADRIEKSTDIGECDIVEFGVEASCFERRLYDAKDRLGEMSKGDVLAFSGEVQRFLSRFESWKIYENDPDGSVGYSKEAAVLGATILKNAISAGILTPDAALRVEGTLSSNDRNDEGRQEGISKSSENLASVLGKNALQGATNVGKEISGEVAKATAKVAVESSKSFIVSNAPTLLRFAQLRGGRWLEMLTDLFS